MKTWKSSANVWPAGRAYSACVIWNLLCSYDGPKLNRINYDSKRRGCIGCEHKLSMSSNKDAY